MKAVLFVGHGSRLASGNEEVRHFIENMIPAMDGLFPSGNVLLGICGTEYIKGIDNCVKRGATEVIVIPIILLHAGHSKLHIPAEIEEGKTKYPEVKFTYGQTIGVHHDVLTILTDRLEEVGIRNHLRNHSEDSDIANWPRWQ